MEIEYLNQDNEKEWNDFALNSDMAWFRHTTDWQKYSSCCRFDSDSINCSFMVKQNREIVAIVPLIKEYNYSDREKSIFAMYGDYTPLPALKNNCEVNKKSILDVINDEISKISQNKHVNSGKFFIDPLIKYDYHNDFSFHNMVANGAELEFKTTNIVDLRHDEETIIRNMRKGHKAAIKKIMKSNNFHIDIFDCNNITKEKLLKFKEIHKIDAGRQTRTNESWDCMYEWIKKGNAILGMLWSNANNDYICAALIMTYKNAAYYGSYGIIDSCLLDGLAGYALQWEIIKYLKDHNIEYYETGQNYYTTLATENDKKLSEIAKFKRGFRSLEFIELSFYKNYFEEAK